MKNVESLLHYMYSHKAFAEARCDTNSIFKQSLTGLNS